MHVFLNYLLEFWLFKKFDVNRPHYMNFFVILPFSVANYSSILLLQFGRSHYCITFHVLTYPNLSVFIVEEYLVCIRALNRSLGKTNGENGSHEAVLKV